MSGNRVSSLLITDNDKLIGSHRPRLCATPSPLPKALLTTTPYFQHHEHGIPLSWTAGLRLGSVLKNEWRVMFTLSPFKNMAAPNGVVKYW